jgi:hypothetical protein
MVQYWRAQRDGASTTASWLSATVRQSEAKRARAVCSRRGCLRQRGYHADHTVDCAEDRRGDAWRLALAEAHDLPSLPRDLTYHGCGLEPGPRRPTHNCHRQPSGRCAAAALGDRICCLLAQAHQRAAAEAVDKLAEVELAAHLRIVAERESLSCCGKKAASLAVGGGAAGRSWPQKKG